MDQSAVQLMPHPAMPGLRLRVAILFVLALFAPASVQAQCLLCTSDDAPADAITARDAAEMPLNVTITADLDFSRLAAGTGGGTVTLDPTSGTSVARGNVAAIGGFGFGGRVSVTGTPGRTIRISLPDTVVLTSSTGRTAYVRDLVTSLPPLARIGISGRLDFVFGGRLEIDGGADGSYTGRVAITVSYE